MKSFLALLLLLASASIFSQNIPVIKVTDLEKRIYNNSDTTYIVNFWATWCAPCVKELPDFDSISKTYPNQKIKVLLVTMDFKEDLNSKVVPFVKKKKIVSDVVLLDELNADYFIPKIANEWTGALPATVIINNKKDIKHFFEKKLTYEFLKNEIQQIELK